MRAIDQKEIAYCKWLIKRFKAGYGCNCKTSDLDDFRKMYTNKKYTMHEMVLSESRCPSCRAAETVKFLEEHIELIEFGG